MAPSRIQSIPATAEEIGERYNRFADLYARSEVLPELLGMRRIRRRLLQRASGNVLEVAVGTGLNLPYYPRSCRVIAVDLSESMLDHARARAKKLSLPVDFRLMDAEHLTFRDAAFDTVVSTMSTCTFIDPLAVLREVGRVCKPEGRILLLEHGRSSRAWLARWQDRRTARHAQQFGCHWNREPDQLVREAGLDLRHHRRHLFGIFHEIVAAPLAGAKPRGPG